MPRYTFGSISTGTLQPRDLIPAFADALADVAADSEYEKLVADAESLTDYDSDEAADILQELTDALEVCAPPYFYFGAHPGDGADFGFWLSEDALQDFDGLRVSDTSEIPDDYSGEVLHVNDHGNMTLYAKDEGSTELRELWSLV